MNCAGACDTTEVDRIKTEFISIVSHELRTPLTAIKGSLGLISGAMAATLPPQVQALLDIANTSTDRLMLLINDIVDLDRLSVGDAPFENRRHSVARIMERALLASEGHPRPVGLRVDCAPIDSTLDVTVDERRFVQVISNLLSNALKFSPAHGCISVEARRSRGGRVRISIADQGPGVPVQFQSRLFERFTMADASPTRSVGGTGIGLHLARELVERMGGSIGCDSPPGSGATFWIEFPLTA